MPLTADEINNEIRLQIRTTLKHRNGHYFRKDELRLLADHLGADYTEEDTNAELRAAILRATGRDDVTASDVSQQFTEPERMHIRDYLDDE